MDNQRLISFIEYHSLPDDSSSFVVSSFANAVKAMRPGFMLWFCLSIFGPRKWARVFFLSDKCVKERLKQYYKGENKLNCRLSDSSSTGTMPSISCWFNSMERMKPCLSQNPMTCVWHWPGHKVHFDGETKCEVDWLLSICSVEFPENAFLAPIHCLANPSNARSCCARRHDSSAGTLRPWKAYGAEQGAAISPPRKNGRAQRFRGLSEITIRLSEAKYRHANKMQYWLIDREINGIFHSRHCRRRLRKCLIDRRKSCFKKPCLLPIQ